MNTELLKYTRDGLAAHKGNWKAIADGAGVSIRTLEKIGWGVVKDPRIKTVEKIAKHLVSLESEK